MYSYLGKRNRIITFFFKVCFDAQVEQNHRNFSLRGIFESFYFYFHRFDRSLKFWMNCIDCANLNSLIFRAWCFHKIGKFCNIYNLKLLIRIFQIGYCRFSEIIICSFYKVRSKVLYIVELWIKFRAKINFIRKDLSYLNYSKTFQICFTRRWAQVCNFHTEFHIETVCMKFR